MADILSDPRPASDGVHAEVEDDRPGRRDTGEGFVERGAERTFHLDRVERARTLFVVEEPPELVGLLRERADRLTARVNAASPDVGS